MPCELVPTENKRDILKPDDQSESGCWHLTCGLTRCALGYQLLDEIVQIDISKLTTFHTRCINSSKPQHTHRQTHTQFLRERSTFFFLWFFSFYFCSIMFHKLETSINFSLNIQQTRPVWDGNRFQWMLLCLN